MKKLSAMLLSITILLLLTACQTETKNDVFIRDGYSKTDVSLYDTKSQEHIYLGDSKATVVKILGEPEEKPSQPTSKGLQEGKIYIYNNIGVEIIFDDKDTIEYLKLSKSIYSNDESIKLAEMLVRNSTVDDFMRCFPDAYESNGLEMYKRKRITFKEEGNVLSVAEQGNYTIYADYDSEDNDILRMVITYDK